MKKIFRQNSAMVAINKGRYLYLKGFVQKQSIQVSNLIDTYQLNFPFQDDGPQYLNKFELQQE